mgnify:CR=1 FL=1
MSGSPRTSYAQPASELGGTKNEQDGEALLVGAQAAASMLAISPRLLWSLTKRDAIPCRRIGRRVLYRPAELEAWLDAGAPTEPGAARGIYARSRKP